MLGKLYSGMHYSAVRHQFNVNELTICIKIKCFQIETYITQLFTD